MNTVWDHVGFEFPSKYIASGVPKELINVLRGTEREFGGLLALIPARL